MFLRSAVLACAAAFAALAAAPANAETRTPSCEAASFRVYFAHGSARLDPAAMETLEAASRTVAGCNHAELQISLDASSPYAARRAAAIRAATEGQGWDAVRVAPRLLSQASAGPEYADVVMSPETLPAMDASAPEAEAGV